MKDKHVVVVGAGPGGLASAMLLAHRGCKVTLFERAAKVGGRNAAIRQDGFTWDTGPTFLMMPFVLERVFEESGRKLADYLDLIPLDPLYRMAFDDFEFYPSADPAKTRAEISRLFPGNEEGFDRFLAVESARFEKLIPCLEKPYDSLLDYLDPTVLKAVPYLAPGRSIYQNLSQYFDSDRLRLCFTFQAKYLGMSPWECPALFTILPYIEHGLGIRHVRGGLNQISEAMAKVIKEHGGEIHVNTPIKRLVIQGRTCTGVELESGEKVEADAVFLNADFGHAMRHLVDPAHLRKYTETKLKRMKISCSTFMLYLGVDRIYDDRPHHSILFSTDYQRNIREVAQDLVLSDDPSIYVQNASVTDPTLAPAGQSTLYILAPVPNQRSGIDWDANYDTFRERVLDLVERRGGFTDLRDHIVCEQSITPSDWQHAGCIFDGATFNLSHNLMQLLSLRPHNRFEEFDRCWLVGGGTHPGSGLPTIYESARISTRDFFKKMGVN